MKRASSATKTPKKHPQKKRTTISCSRGKKKPSQHLIESALEVWGVLLSTIKSLHKSKNWVYNNLSLRLFQAKSKTGKQLISCNRPHPHWWLLITQSSRMNSKVYRALHPVHIQPNVGGVIPATTVKLLRTQLNSSCFLDTDNSEKRDSQRDEQELKARVVMA